MITHVTSYIDRTVLLENKALKDSYETTSSLVRILLMTSFPAFPWLFVQTVIEKWRAIDS